MDKRASGVLMHITSLPGKFGIGTFGKEAYDFIDFLVETKQTYWQILPLTTTSFGDSPYQSFSAMAGNTHLIDFDFLAQEGILEETDYANVVFSRNDEEVDYELLFDTRRPILEKAVDNFLSIEEFKQDYAAFESDNHSWLTNYAEFMALKEHFDNKALPLWDDQKAISRDEETLTHYRQLLAKEIHYHKVCQYFFFSQWQKLKAYANQRNIAIIGDMPIYVSADSVEVWTMPELFKLDDERNPLFVAGVPADDFSADGQLWGNPIYDWENHAKTGYAWWIERIRESFKLYDYLRIDHFKGFSDYWEIDGKAAIARYGSWQPGPGIDLFNAVKEALGELPIIAEDLGNIDEKARQLLQAANFPGMKVLEFGFYDIEGKSIDSPHRCIPNSVAYSGTHDNEVINGWYDNLSPEQKDYFDAYSNRKPIEPVSQAMLRVLFATSSNTVIATMQDILDKDADSRMNMPSTVGGNWQWRMKKEELTQDKKDFLIKITTLYQRGNEKNDLFN
ncbi:4-alpha-glucanotransferase [Streptococcus pacificus]|uniref:4-alpha-glucanotransferase n=1 Tax=Streptococcus pacificus TaxID=2740577 RepID=A0ABS0ZIW8_9STRE|nr:4-alpha-glucanotransferase [Streptococcus pacificus]MBJ8325930.1 4-alpha-glucanotransferase [Streptococcus pacificus]